MKDEKFTPGEWRAEITRVYLSDGRMMWIEGKNFETQEANAHLIAAAPEMYALLKMIADPATFMGSLTNEALRIAIESVLKKARGEE